MDTGPPVPVSHCSGSKDKGGRSRAEGRAPRLACDPGAEACDLLRRAVLGAGAVAKGTFCQWKNGVH